MALIAVCVDLRGCLQEGELSEQKGDLSEQEDDLSEQEEDPFEYCAFVLATLNSFPGTLCSGCADHVASFQPACALHLAFETPRFGM